MSFFLPFLLSPTQDTARASNSLDPSTLSNSNQSRDVDLALNVEIDFEAKRIFGTATYEVEIVASSSKLTYVSFDCKDLIITSTSINGKKCDFDIVVVEGMKPEIFGKSLRVMLPSSALSLTTLKVSIEYSTTPSSSAIQWLPPAQTLGKKHPYLFTQCQAIHARTLLPCQDSPATKMTYKATVTAASWATVLMSALSRGSSPTPNSSSSKVTWTWEQPVPTSTYLIAFCVGDLASRDISGRCRVWAEPGIVDAVAHEFAETELFLAQAEKLTLPYPWGRYDVVCLPPSFPYGGMENPCLTFVTPTLLAGDRSLADVVAHEIAHSWTGNLVTNATWEHFWLNEGFTMWLQRKIMARIKGDDKVFDFDAIGGWEHLRDDVKLLPPNFTRLVPIIKGCDPDDAFSGVPYEKGFNLLYALERRVGSPAFEEFARSYMKSFKFHTVTSTEFRSFFESYFNGNEATKAFPWDEWFHKPGMPAEEPPFDRTLSQASADLASQWVSFDSLSGPLPSVDIGSWTTSRRTCLLDALLAAVDGRKVPLRGPTVRAMDEQYRMSATQNSEVLFRFARLAIGAEDATILPVAIKFITTQGRMKFVRPLYRALFASKMGKALAVKAFLEHRSFYHSIASKMIASDMGLVDGEKAAAPPREKEESKSANRLLLIAGVVGVVAVIAVVFARKRK